MIKKILHKILNIPIVFELQQKYCNDYSTVQNEFSDILNKEKLKIIDIGCSTGQCSSQIINMKKHSYVGIDIDPLYIKLAKKRKQGGRFEEMDARNLKFKSNSFDLAMFIGVLHHMDDDLISQCLREIKRVLKKNGKIIIAEPVYTKENWISTFLLNLDRGKHIRTRENYEKLFKPFKLRRKGFFIFSNHRFCSFVFNK
jgi:ubiquinone/menaquinone biosynthesis C-methylase UbiE